MCSLGILVASSIEATQPRRRRTSRRGLAVLCADGSTWACRASTSFFLAASLCLGLAADTRTLWFTNAASVSIPSSGAAPPYPSTIELSGLPGVMSNVKVALDRLEHSYPDDLDILLVNSHTNVLLLSDRGGANAITNVTLLFDDLAAGLVPDSSKISSGTFKPSNDGNLDYLPSPTPFPPHGTLLNGFAGASPNGTWSLYVVDDTGGDAGVLAGGWRLCITTTNLLSPGNPGEADMSLTLTASRNPALTEQPLTWLLTVINSGPTAASGVVVSNSLPGGVQFISATSSQGTCAQSGGLVTCNVGELASGATMTVRVQVIPLVVGSLSSTAAVGAMQTDQAPDNNTATAITAVQEGPPALTVADVTVIERTAKRTNAVFTLSLSHPSDKTVKVDYATADGTASDSSDYYATSGTASFDPGRTNLTVETPVLGDTTVESDEHFFLNLSAVVNALVTRSQARATIVNDDGAAGRVSRFQWSAMASPQYQYVPVPATITALDAAGNSVAAFNGPVALTGLTGAGTNAPRLLLTEVDLSSDGIELENLTSLPLDLTGWQVCFYDWISWPYPTEVFEFPSGAVAPAAGVMTVGDAGTAPGSYPAFYTSQGISWYNEATNNPVAVLLLDPAGQPADFFCAVDAYAADILDPLPIPSTQWSGSPAAANTSSTLTYQRTGSVDHNGASDWQLVTTTMGSANAGLAGPFAGPRLVSLSPANISNFSSGTWSGTVTVNESVTNLYLLARDDDGHVGTSGWFAVQPSTDLALSHTVSPASLTVSQEVVFTLRVTNSGPGSAQSVIVADTLPANTVYKSASSTQGTVSRSGSAVTANLGSLAAGASAVVAITATASAPGGATNTATVSTASVDYQVANNSASASAWVNYPPAITTIPSQAVSEDGILANIPFAVGDFETSPDSLSVWATSSNPALVRSEDLVLGGAGTNRTLTVTPLPDQFGTASITVFVADSQNTSSTQFTLNVSSVNDAPVLLPIAAQSVPEGQTLTVNPVASNVENPAETLTFALVSAPSGANVNPSSGRITWMPSEMQGPGVHSFTLRVYDNGVPSLSATQSFSVSVSEVNSAPALNAVPSQTVNVPASLNIQAVASDPDLPANLLSFALVSGPAGLTVSASGVIAWTPPPDFLPSTNTVLFRVLDNGSPSLSTTGAFQVVVNHQPIPACPVLNRFSPVAAKLPIQNLLGSDPDGDNLTLVSLASPSTLGMPVTRDEKWVYYTPPGAFPNPDAFTYGVRDARGATASGTVTLNVVADTTVLPSLSVKDMGGGSFFVRFSGIPGVPYAIQATASQTTPDWQRIGSATADSFGVVSYIDSPPGGAVRYYRLCPD